MARLLSHYWKDSETNAVRTAIAEDWVNDLKDLELDCVAEACTEWRRTETSRPKIPNIRRLAIAKESEKRATARALAPPSSSERPALPMGWDYDARGDRIWIGICWPLPPEGYCNHDGFGHDAEYRPLLPLWDKDPPLPSGQKPAYKKFRYQL